MISGERSPVDPKDSTPRNKDLAASFCWICALDQSASHLLRPAAATAKGPKPTPMQRYQQFSNLDWIPVCNLHHADICQCCCWSTRTTSSGESYLQITDDEDAFGSTPLEICGSCRLAAIHVNQPRQGTDFRESRITEDYVILGDGTAKEAGEALNTAQWLYSNRKFLEIMQELDDKFGWKAYKYSQSFKDRSKGWAAEGVEWVGSKGFTEKVSDTTQLRVIACLKPLASPANKARP